MNSPYPPLLLPGMMCDARLFAPQIAAINKRAVMVAPIHRHDNMADLAADILTYAPPQFILGGLSMGGIVAMELLRQAPDRIAGLILMDTNPLAEDDEVKARRALHIEKVRAGGLAEVMRDEMKPNYLAEAEHKQEILDLCMEMALDLGDDVFIRQSMALRDRPNQTETLKQFGGPALILHGEHDRLCPAHRHELMHELMPQASYEMIKGAGHLPTLERPEEVNEVLSKWLKSIENNGSRVIPM